MKPSSGSRVGLGVVVSELTFRGIGGGQGDVSFSEKSRMQNSRFRTNDKLHGIQIKFERGGGTQASRPFRIRLRIPVSLHFCLLNLEGSENSGGCDRKQGE